MKGLLKQLTVGYRKRRFELIDWNCKPARGRSVPEARRGPFLAAELEFGADSDDFGADSVGWVWYCLAACDLDGSCMRPGRLHHPARKSQGFPWVICWMICWVI